MTPPPLPNTRRSVARVVAAMAAVGAGWFAAASSPATADCDSLAIPSIGLERCVVGGGQPEIDAGNVVRFDALSSPRVHWLAGHRTSHGGTFGSLVDVAIGDQVEYRGQRFEIVEYQLVDRHQPVEVVGWFEPPSQAVVLQTSAHDVYVHVWRTRLVASTATRVAATTTTQPATPTTSPPVTAPVESAPVVVEVAPAETVPAIEVADPVTIALDELRRALRAVDPIKAFQHWS